MRGISSLFNLSSRFANFVKFQPMPRTCVCSLNAGLLEGNAPYYYDHPRLVHLGHSRNADFSSVSLRGKDLPTATPVLDSLKERGLFHDDLYRHYFHLKIDTSPISPNGKTVDIVWSDGHKSKFHAIWLRHFCHCSHCKLDNHGMITVDFDQVDRACVIKSFELEGDEMILIKWTSDVGEREHEGFLPKGYLRAHCYSKESLDMRSQMRAMGFNVDFTIPEVDYKEVSSSELGLYKWLSTLSDRGICLLKNVPTEQYYVKTVAERIAPIQHTIYGETFDVKSTKNPVNAAYSEVRLLPHMDQINYESPPGLQMLHCLEFDSCIVGGESIFLDIHEVAHKFRQENPELFNALARIPFTSQMVNYCSEFSHNLKIQRPIFILNHREELVSVNWHPMLLGASEIPPEDIDLFYTAYIAFYRMISRTPRKYEFRLTPGDLISFNNRRILHARNKFMGSDGNRFLQGTYIEASEFQSKIQVLHDRYGNGRLATRNGSNNWF